MSPRSCPLCFHANVASELIRKSPYPAVATCVAGQPSDLQFFSAVSEAELRHGTAILPAARRRDRLFLVIDAMLRDAFEDRVLTFCIDTECTYGYIAARRRSGGLSVAPSDCRITAIAASRHMAVAARNVRDFEDTGIEIVNPLLGP